MADLTIKHSDEFEVFDSEPGIKLLYAGLGLGVVGWNMNIIKMEPNCSSYREHNHSNDGQEKVYIILRGTAKLITEDGETEMESGMMARIGPEERRKFISGVDGVSILSMSNMLARKSAKS